MPSRPCGSVALPAHLCTHKMLLLVDRIKPVFWENSRKKIWYGVIIRKKIWYGVIIVFDVGRVTRVQGNAISGRNSIGDVLRHCHIYGKRIKRRIATDPVLRGRLLFIVVLFFGWWNFLTEARFSPITQKNQVLLIRAFAVSKNRGSPNVDRRKSRDDLKEGFI